MIAKVELVVGTALTSGRTAGSSAVMVVGVTDSVALPNV